jgi:hypothetical protein
MQQISRVELIEWHRRPAPLLILLLSFMQRGGGGGGGGKNEKYERVARTKKAGPCQGQITRAKANFEAVITFCTLCPFFPLSAPPPLELPFKLHKENTHLEGDPPSQGMQKLPKSSQFLILESSMLNRV